jgi:hypothetical protein
MCIKVRGRRTPHRRSAKLWWGALSLLALTAGLAAAVSFVGLAAWQTGTVGCAGTRATGGLSA